MSFIDEVRFEVTAGKGGRGCASFHRARHIPLGGPNGGDGGRGGSIYLVADEQCATLGHLRRKRHYKATPGVAGQSTNKSGASGQDLEIKVPIGTKVIDDASGMLVMDLVQDGRTFCVAKGGDGGLGNMHFKSATNRSPRQFTEGEPGESRVIRLELQVLADVGLLGFPNAGKSTFLRQVSAARPKVADYPFTTLQPHLGVVDIGWDGGFVMADIPGLLEGASEGIGLGLRFLKHLSRCELLLHLIEVSDVETEVAAWKKVNKELVNYSQALSEKPQAVVLTKIDTLVAEEVTEHLNEFRSLSGWQGQLMAISSFSGAGVDALKQWTAQAVHAI